MFPLQMHFIGDGEGQTWCFLYLKEGGSHEGVSAMNLNLRYASLENQGRTSMKRIPLFHLVYGEIFRRSWEGKNHASDQGTLTQVFSFCGA